MVEWSSYEELEGAMISLIELVGQGEGGRGDWGDRVWSWGGVEAHKQQQGTARDSSPLTLSQHTKR